MKEKDDYLKKLKTTKEQDMSLKKLKAQAQAAVNAFTEGVDGITKQETLEEIGNLPQDEQEPFITAVLEYEKALKEKAQTKKVDNKTIYVCTHCEAETTIKSRKNQMCNACSLGVYREK